MSLQHESEMDVEELDSGVSDVCSVNNLKCSFSFQEQTNKPKTLVCAALVPLHIFTIHMFYVLLLHCLSSLLFTKLYMFICFLYLSHLISIHVIQTNHCTFHVSCFNVEGQWRLAIIAVSCIQFCI